jgi:hypothetical protein
MRNRNLGATTSVEANFKMQHTFQSWGCSVRRAGGGGDLQTSEQNPLREELTLFPDPVSQTAPINPTEVIVC